MKSRYDITANVMWNWDAKQKRTKFAPGDHVKVIQADYKCDYSSTERNNKVGAVGRIIAVSQAKPGCVRDGLRAFTRYYVEFSDGTAHGFHSHFLKKHGPHEPSWISKALAKKEASKIMQSGIELKVSEIESLYNLRHKLVEIQIDGIRVKVIKG